NPKAIKQIKKRTYNELNEDESIQNEGLTEDTWFSYYRTYPILVRYLHRKIKLHHKKKIAFDNKTLLANQTVGEDYLPDITNTPITENNLIVIERYIDYFMKDWEVCKNTNELAFEQPWTHEKSKALLKALDQYSDNEDLCYSKEKIMLILHKHCMSPELTDKEYQELYLQDKKQLIVHKQLQTILNKKAGIQCPSNWSPFSKRKKKDNGILRRVHPESDYSQYDKLISFLPDKLSFLPDWA
ncbi:4142_t:CDS:2, partial [Racocetra persica]